MTQEQFDKIVNAAKQNELNVSKHPNYSGRGMFGEQTLAISGDEYDILDALMHAHISMREFRRDSLGKGYIIY